MSNMRIGYQNYADSATITADPVADTACPVAFVQNTSRGEVFQSTGVADQTIYLTWGGDTVSAGLVRVDGHNLAYNDTIRAIGYPNADWTGTPEFDTTATAAYASGLFDAWKTRRVGLGFAFTDFWLTESSVKSVSILISSGSNPDGVISVRRLFVGPYIETTRNPSATMRSGWRDPSESSRALLSGTRRVQPAGKYRVITADLASVSESERAVWMELSATVGVSKDFAVSVFPGVGGTQERDLSMMGMFSESLEDAWSQFSDYTKSLVMEEI